jgi:hypothetical protein
MRPLRVAACVGIVAATLVGVPMLLAAADDQASSARPAVGALGELLPDLDVAYPYRLEAQVVSLKDGKHVLLAFASEAMNVGEGPLVLLGSRDSLAEETMTAVQVIRLANGGERLREGVGHFEYVTDPTHQHWHLLPFMRYELHRASDFKLIVPDRKTGFCLGDRVDALPNTTLPGEPDRPVYNTNCGPEALDILGLQEGISVGWADVYERWRDGQYLDITGLAAGRYVLVHRVNVGKVLAESRYSNNASSVLISITWPDGKESAPKLKVLRQCSQIARCGA